MLQLPLQYGPHDIGFKYHCIFDERRFYQTYHPEHQTTLRPIPLNIWYPAQKTIEVSSMYYQDYWNFQSSDSSLTSFHHRLKNDSIEKARLYFSGKKIEDRTELDEELFQELLQSPVKALKNAPKVEESFPLVIYHQGLNAHIEDNFLLLEYLASWGYIVVSSSYHPMNAQTLGIDWDLERSIKDIETIIQYQQRQFNVKDSQIALIGHSFGAQVMLGLMGEKYEKYRSRFKASVLIDSTLDYEFYKKNPRILEILATKQHQFQNPILAFARLSATFDLLNKLQSANRYYCKIGQLLHNDFISIGVMETLIRSKKHQGDFKVIWQRYQQVCVFTHHFLETFVKNNSKSQKLFEKNNFEKLSGDGLQCELLQRGKSKRFVETYQKESRKAPTFEQLVELLQKEGMEAFYELYRQFPHASIFAPVAVEELGEYFLEYLKMPDLAREIVEFYVGLSAA